MTNGRCGSAAEEPIVCRLTAGGKWIRTIGSRKPATPSPRPPMWRADNTSDATEPQKFSEC